VDFDHIGAFRQVVEHALVAIQGVAQLIEIGDLELSPMLDGTGIRCGSIQQQAYQGGFPAAVGAENANAVTTHHGQGKIAEQRPASKNTSKMIRFDDDFAGTVTLLDSQSRSALAVAALSVLRAQCLECTHAAFVTSASGFDALTDPAFLLTELLVELGIDPVLVIQCRLFASEVLVVVAGPAGQSATIQLDNTGRQSADEGA